MKTFTGWHFNILENSDRDYVLAVEDIFPIFPTHCLFTLASFGQ